MSEKITVRGWNLCVAWCSVVMTGGMIGALVFSLPWYAVLAAIVAAFGITCTYLVRFLRPSWRPLRTQPFTSLFAFFALTILPSSLTSLQPVRSLLYAVLALGVWLAVHAIREAFSEDEHGLLSPDAFARILTGGAMLIVGGRLAYGFLSDSSMLLWVNLAPSDNPAARLYGHLPDFITAAIFPIPVAFALNTPRLPQRRLWLFGALILGGGVLLSYGRASIFVLIAELFALVVIMRARRHTAMVAGSMLIVLIIGALLLPGVQERLHSVLRYGQGTAGFRIELWRATILLISHAPFLGYGLGTFPDVAATIPVIGENTRISCPHNFYLHLATECGVPALLIFTGGCAVVIGRIFRAFVPAAIGDGDTRNGLRLAFLMLVAGLVVYGLFDT